MVYGWFIARQLSCGQVHALGFSDALWMPRIDELISRLNNYTKINKETIKYILEYLTFGRLDIRNPDIATQPLIDLENDHYALCSMVWLNTNCERNICVLLNQIKEEQKIYSKLVNDKEESLINEIKDKLKNKSLDFRSGKLQDTDVDLAIIDHKNKVCICVELKWFIEPAEVREVIQRSKEIQKGITQVKKISLAWENENIKLLSDILCIDKTYKFLSIVAPVTSIGNAFSQDSSIPVVKLWHLIQEIDKCSNLFSVHSWLKSRSYLPQKDKDYEIITTELKIGKWECKWYGVKHA